MMSPFPGIDPYLESQNLWHDIHPSFIAALRDTLSERLPEPYVARIDERLNLVEYTSETFVEEQRATCLEIWQWPDRRLVTAIELLSPTNKSGGGLRDDLAKRNALIRQDVNLVELDFLVAGRRPPMEAPLPVGNYFAFVARGGRRPDCDVYAWALRDRIPVIPIPILPPDADIRVDLGPIFTGMYTRARDGRSIDYKAPLTLPLPPEMRAWAEELARAAAG